MERPRPGRRGSIGGQAARSPADREVGREQAGEEHHLRGDEQDHPEDRVADPAACVVGQPRDGRCARGDGRACLCGRQRSTSRSSMPRLERRSAPLLATGGRACGCVRRGERRTAAARSGSRAGGRSCTAAAASVVAHSSVLPSHGSSPAIFAAPERDEHVPEERHHARRAIMKPPIVAARFNSFQPRVGVVGDPPGHARPGRACASGRTSG